jgi:hypothetical protein
MTGWNLPPGCSTADIDRAAGADREPSAEGEEILGLLESLAPDADEKAVTAVHDRVVAIVEELAEDRVYRGDLLHRALAKLPADAQRPVCTCKPDFAARINFGWCDLHDGDALEPTLREEIERELKEEP